jgi:hypothetical protein
MTIPVIKNQCAESVFLILFVLMAFGQTLSSQNANSYKLDLEASAGFITPDRMPFWLRANQFGDVPLDNASMGYSGMFLKDYENRNGSLFDWGAGFYGKVNVGQTPNAILIEGYAKARLWIIELKAGRSRDMMGLADSTLSLGAFSISGTAPGIPKIEVGIPDYWPIPFLGNLISIKGNFVHGWLGNLPMELDDIVFPVTTYFHQKSLYGRLGNENWKLKLYGGFNHQVQWGNEAEYYGEDIYGLTLPETYLYMLTGTAYGTPDIPRSKIGNHLGSIDLGMEYDFPSFRIFAYRQNFYEVGALYYLANIRDGLNGLSFVNTTRKTSGFRWENVLLEFFYSKNQAGEFWSPYTPSGDENYYNNFQYVEGWSYLGFNLGNPLIGTRQYIQDDLPRDPGNYFINNRVTAFHSGFQGSFNEWDFSIKLTYSINQGTYGTSVEGHSIGDRRDPPKHGIFPKTQQFSGYLDVNKSFRNNMMAGIRAAIDDGKLYYNSSGIMLVYGISF